MTKLWRRFAACLSHRARRGVLYFTTRLGWKKIQRALAAISGPVAFTLLTLVFAAVLQGHRRHSEYGAPFFPIYWLIIGGAVLWCIQSYLMYEKRTHDPRLALEYQNLFDSDTMRRRKRPEAAQALRDFRDEKLRFDSPADRRVLRRKVDDILDIFEDIGFLVQGNQISPEVAHHYFDYWLQGYWRAAKPYLELERKEESAEWNHIEYLARISQQVEYWVTLDKREIQQEDFREFLDEEMDLPQGLDSNGPSGC
ncbi:MAG: hypothetical protein WB681_08460 [Candidatus Cybelea sp.]